MQNNEDSKFVSFLQIFMEQIYTFCHAVYLRKMHKSQKDAAWAINLVILS